MIVVKHMCGHTQDTNLDRLAKVAYKLGKTAQQFIEEQVTWLELNLCPDCYRKARDLPCYKDYSEPEHG
jgi:hypothetical protein